MSKLNTEDSRGGESDGLEFRTVVEELIGGDTSKRDRTRASPSTLAEPDELEEWLESWMSRAGS
jgi:hypothetical protein